MDCSPSGCSVHGILQARILECLSPRDLPDPGIEPMSAAAPALLVDSFLLSQRGSPHRRVQYINLFKRLIYFKIHGVTKSQTWLSNWTELNWTYPSFSQDVRESFLCEISRKAFVFLMKRFHRNWHCFSLFIFPFCSWNADVITGVQQLFCCYRMSSIKYILIQS